MRILLVSLALLAGGCSADGYAKSSRSRSTSPSTEAASSEAPRGVRPSTSGASSTAVPSGKNKISVAEARRYMVELINRDRASMGLQPVTLDEGAAEKSGQRHANDMAEHGFLGHWGTDGSVPEQRYSEAGGSDFVMENASCVTDEKTRELDPSPKVDREAVEHAEYMFFNETPPNDGHRKNILKPEHKKVGIGIALAKATATEIPGLCLTQEFVDPYGHYASIPKQAKAGGTVRVEGSVVAPAKFGGVGIARVDAPRPTPVSDLNRRRTYPIPEPYEVYWPKGYKTKIPVETTGSGFHIDVPLDRGPGLYEISIMGQFPGQKSYGIIGLRTIQVL